jgi:hypothetical protein
MCLDKKKAFNSGQRHGNKSMDVLQNPPKSIIKNLNTSEYSISIAQKVRFQIVDRGKHQKKPNAEKKDNFESVLNTSQVCPSNTWSFLTNFVRKNGHQHFYM